MSPRPAFLMSQAHRQSHTCPPPPTSLSPTPLCLRVRRGCSVHRCMLHCSSFALFLFLSASFLSLIRVCHEELGEGVAGWGGGGCERI